MINSTFDELLETLTHEEALCLTSFIKQQACINVNIGYWCNRLNSPDFIVTYILGIDLLTERQGMRHLTLETQYMWDGSFMNYQVIDVIDYRNVYERDLLIHCQNLLAEYVHEPD